MKKTVFCTLEIEGLHSWSECPLEEVSYLCDPHRHMFHIKAHVDVTHENRDVEFICLKHKIQQFLQERFYDNVKFLHDFGNNSCEHIALLLIQTFNLTMCEVSEDGENGCTFTIYSGDIF